SHVRKGVRAERASGGAISAAGLVASGREPLASIGTHGLVGDLSFATAGLMFGTFASLLRLWRIPPLRAVAVTGVISLLYVPIYWLAFGFERIIALGLVENLLQLVAQGLLAGPGATYLFTPALVLLLPRPP